MSWTPLIGRLHLDNNRLLHISSLISRLEDLEFLILHSNRLAEISGTICNLTKLSSLDLRNNRLTTLPNSLINLKSLSYISLDSNPLLNEKIISAFTNKFSINLANSLRIY